MRLFCSNSSPFSQLMVGIFCLHHHVSLFSLLGAPSFHFCSINNIIVLDIVDIYSIQNSSVTFPLLLKGGSGGGDDVAVVTRVGI